MNGSLLKLYWQICLLKKPPQTVPHGYGTLLQAIVFAIFTYTFAISPQFSPSMGIQHALLDLFILIVFLLGGLYAKSKKERFMQACSAACGAGGIVNLLAWPILLVMTSDSLSETAMLISSLLMLMIYVWSVLISAHVFSHTFEIKMPFAVGVALAYAYVAIQVSAAVFPRTGVVN